MSERKRAPPGQSTLSNQVNVSFYFHGFCSKQHRATRALGVSDLPSFLIQYHISATKIDATSHRQVFKGVGAYSSIEARYIFHEHITMK